MQTSDTGATAPGQATGAEATPQAESAAPTAETVSRWEDYVDVFLSPAALFRRRAGDHVRTPLITLLVLAVLVYLATMPATGMIMRASMAATTVDADAAETIARFSPIMQWIGVVFAPIGYLAIVVGTALLLRIGAWLTDIRLDFSRAVLISTYAASILLLAQVVVSAMVLLQGEAGLVVPRDTSLGLLRFVWNSEMTPLSIAVLSRIELFTVWHAALWAIGLEQVADAGRGRAVGIAVGTWVLAGLPAIIGALLGSAAGGAGTP